MGPLDFLDSQSSFDLIFGLRLSMLRIFKRGKKSCATKDTHYLAARLRKFIQSCQLHIFCDAVQLQYVGTNSYESHKMFADISLALSSLKMVSYHKGRIISLTPDDWFQSFLRISSSTFLECDDLIIFLNHPLLQRFISRAIGGCRIRRISSTEFSHSHNFSFAGKRSLNSAGVFGHSF